MERKRLFYVDALRGLAIICVVMGHLDLFCIKSDNGLSISWFVNLFHMPLFMMISGYVLNTNKISIQKRAKLLVPLCVFGGGIAYNCLKHSYLQGFIINEAKLGYWFLWTIFIYFIALKLIVLSKIKMIYGMLMVQGLFVIVHALFRQQPIGLTLSTDHLWMLWPSFCVGVWIKSTKYFVNICADHKKLKRFFLINVALIIPLFIIALVNTNNEVDKLNSVMIGIPFSLAFFAGFYYLEQKYSGKQFVLKTQIKQIGNAIGTHTLEIYVLHYFIVYNWDISQYIAHQEIPFFLLFNIIFTFILAIIIAYICIGCSKILSAVNLDIVFGK